MEKRLKKVMSFVLAGALLFMSCLPVKAATGDVTKGSFTVHKYDITAAEQAGVDLSTFESTGLKNTAAETALEKYAIKGVEFTYLRVGEVKQISEAGTVQLTYEVPDALQNILALKKADAIKVIGDKVYFSSTQINEALASALLDNTKTKDALEDYITNGTKMPETDATGVSTVDNLDLGLYLIVETKVPENVTYTTDPFFVQLPMVDNNGNEVGDINMYPKNQTGNPTLYKKVRNNTSDANVVTANNQSIADFTASKDEYKYADTVTVSTNEKLDYELVSKLPHITSKSTYLTTYTFNDTLAKGITYGKDAVVAIYDDNSAMASTNVDNVKDSNALEVWEKGSDMFTATYDATKNTMKIALTDKGLAAINKNYSDKYIAVFYTADVNKDNSVVLGDAGNSNDVSLTWKRTSTNYYDILKDETIVYIYGINLLKTFSDNDGDATKVKFTAQNTSDNYYLTATGANGVYFITGKVKTKAEATQFSPNTDGSLVINGIEADTYALVEIHSDNGYALLTDPVNVAIKSSTAVITGTEANVTGIKSKSENDSTANDGKVVGATIGNDVTVVTTAASAKVDGSDTNMSKSGESDNALVDVKVINRKAFKLPQTGGAGIYAMTIVGVLVIIAGIVCVFRKKDKKKTDM